MTLAPSSRLGRYEILAPLGSGSMGHVYRARDTRLGRDVAIKIIADGNTDEQALRRFEQEAQTVSALNHPNILTVFDVGRSEGISFIVAELIDGESLRTVLSRGGLPMPELLDIALGVAEGLEAAHEAGIVHRDLKPENLMLTRDGRVKILDFGIAKVVEKSATDTLTTMGQNQTAPGLLLGTVSYMSPEQARGARVSYWADQFSLGVILWEMATGSPVFQRETPLGSLAAILTEDPPMLTVGSAHFQWLVRRLLHKEPDHRYASMTDVLRELRAIRANLTEESTPAVPPPIPPTAEEPSAPVVVGKRRRLLWLPIAALIIGAALATAVFLVRGVGRGSGTVALEYTPFAVSAGMDVDPAWSPDGRTIVYSAETGGAFQIWSRAAKDSSPSVQITFGEEDAFSPFWSADGARVLYLSESMLRSVSATGGPPETVEKGVLCATASKQDGTLATVRADGRLYVGKRQIALTHNFLPGCRLQFSPDGKTLAADNWLVDTASGKGVGGATSGVVWASGRDGVASRDGHLYLTDEMGQRLSPLTAGTGSESSPSVSPDGHEVAFVSGGMEHDVVQISLNGSIRPLLTTARNETYPAFTRVGDLAYVAGRAILLRNPGDWERAAVTAPSSSDPIGSMALSPDAQRVAFENDGAIRVSTLRADSPVLVAHGQDPAWSADGSSLAYTKAHEGGQLLMITRPGSVGAPVSVADRAGRAPQWSPLGDRIATRGDSGLQLIPVNGGSRRTLGTGHWFLHGWSQDGQTLVGVRRSNSRHMELVSVRVSDATENVLADMGPLPAALGFAAAHGIEPMAGFSWNREHDAILTAIVKGNTDIWILRR